MRFFRCLIPVLAALPCLLAARPAASASRTVYRLYLPVPAFHLYVTDAGERDAAIAQGAQFEGIAMGLVSDPLPGRVPLYDLFEPGLQHHLYVSDAAERAALLAQGWQDRGILGYLHGLPALGRLPLYRLFKPGTGDHLLTASTAERDAAQDEGYELEGILGYVERPFPFLNFVQADLLDTMLRTHLQYFLDTRTVTKHGLPLAAYKADDRARYGFGTPSDFGYALEVWIAATERGALSMDQALARITVTLNTLSLLQKTFPQHAEGLFFSSYMLTDDQGEDLLAPGHDADVNISSAGNALLYAALIVTEGWARRIGNAALTERAAEIRARMEFRRFLTTSSGIPRLARFWNRDTRQLSSATWDVYADEGGLVAWIALVSGSVSFDEYQAITRAQNRGSATFQGVTVQEATQYNAMAPWGTRSWAGFPIGPWDAFAGTRTPYAAQSLAQAARTHLIYGDLLGISYPAFSDAPTQVRGGQVLTGRFTPANLAGQAPATPPADVTPHALFVPFNAGPALSPEVRDRLLQLIDQLRTDTAGYFHPLGSAQPFGFEVVASPLANQTAYAGAAAGRGVFEARANAAIILSAFTGLEVDAGCETFTDLAAEVPGYRDLASRALAFLYPGALWEVRPSGTTADLRAVVFADPATGFAAGDAGTILKTTDGGTTWQARSLGTPDASLRFLAVHDAATLWVADTHRLWRSTDGGGTWELVWATGQAPSDVETDVITGLGAGAGQLFLTVDIGPTQVGFFVSRDGGKAWSRPAGAASLTARMTGLVNQGVNVWTWSDIGRVWRSADGGESFVSVGRPFGAGLFFLTESVGWFATDRGTWITVNGGALWTAQGDNSDTPLTQVRFGDTQIGWGISPTPGLIYFSPDSGSTWVPQGLPIATRLTALAVSDAANAWAVGQGGVILRYIP
jgi:photosystem II stability/assembly factor-like uncharacterized protein